jgi:hypothetical protein
MKPDNMSIMAMNPITLKWRHNNLLAERPTLQTIIMGVQGLITTIIHMPPGSAGFMILFSDLAIILLSIPGFITAPGGIMTRSGIAPPFILAWAGDGVALDGDFHTIHITGIHTAVTGMVITGDTGMVITDIITMVRAITTIMATDQTWVAPTALEDHQDGSALPSHWVETMLWEELKENLQAVVLLPAKLLK